MTYHYRGGLGFSFEVPGGGSMDLNQIQGGVKNIPGSGDLSKLLPSGGDLSKMLPGGTDLTKMLPGGADVSKVLPSDLLNSIPNSGFDMGQVTASATSAAKAQGGGAGGSIADMAFGYAKDLEDGVKAAERGEVGLMLKAAAPVAADGVCSIFGVPPPTCGGIARSVVNVIADIGDALKNLTGGTDWNKYHNDSRKAWNQLYPTTVELAKLIAIKEQDAIEILRQTFFEILKKRYCWQGWGRGGPPGYALFKPLFLKYYRANAYPDKAARQLLPTRNKSSVKFVTSNCSPNGAQVNLDIPGGKRLWFPAIEDGFTMLGMAKPSVSNNPDCTNVNQIPGPNWPRPPEGDAYFAFMSCMAWGACASSERFRAPLQWYATDLQARNKDIDIALGEALSELEGMAQKYWADSGKPSCAAQVEAERVRSVYTKSLYTQAYVKKLAIETEAQNAATTQKVLIGAAVVGGLGLLWWKFGGKLLGKAR